MTFPSHPLEMSLETLSAAHWPPPPPDASPAVGAGETAGKPRRSPGPPLPAPPRGRKPAPAVTASPGPPAHPDGGSLAPRRPRPRPPPQSGPGARSQGNTFCPRACRPARLSRSLLPASPSSPLLRPRRSPLPPRAPGLAGAVLIGSQGWTAQPGLLPALPPRGARRGRARQEPRRDALCPLGRPQSPPPALQGR